MLPPSPDPAVHLERLATMLGRLVLPSADPATVLGRRMICSTLLGRWAGATPDFEAWFAERQRNHEVKAKLGDERRGKHASSKKILLHYFHLAVACMHAEDACATGRTHDAWAWIAEASRIFGRMETFAESVHVELSGGQLNSKQVASKAAKAKSEPNAAAKAWVLSEWGARRAEFRGKSHFANVYSAKLPEKFGFTVGWKTIAEVWLQGK